jgi:hypothetical protein
MRKVLIALLASAALLLGGASVAGPASASVPDRAPVVQVQYLGDMPVMIVPDGVPVQAKILYPYGCPTGTLQGGWFCLYGDLSFGHINTRYPASITRNQCNNYPGHGEVPPSGGLPGLPATWTYAVVNTTIVSWRVFRTSTCGGSSLTVPGHSSLLLPTGWAAVVDFAFTRTSTVSWP